MRLNNLTSLRFFAALAVFLYHVPAFFAVDARSYLGGIPLASTVSFFFVLSGFVLSYSYGGTIHTLGGAASLFAQRFFRLWPLHVACAIGALLLLPISYAQQFTNMYLYLSLQHAWIPKYSTAFYWNAVSWSISVELFLYAVFCLLMLARPSNARIILAIAPVFLIASLWAASAGLMPMRSDPELQFQDEVTINSFFHFFPPIRITEFFAGVVLHRIYDRFPLPARYVFPAQCGSLLLLSGGMMFERTAHVWLYAYLPHHAFAYIGHAGLFPIYALLIYAFAHQSGLLSSAVSWRPFVFLGEISFAFYMSHQLILRWLHSTQINQSIGDMISVFLAFALTVAASTLLHFLLEKPASKWARRTFPIGTITSDAGGGFEPPIQGKSLFGKA